MRHLLTILATLLLCAAPLHAQTLKSLMYNSTNGQVVANTGTNVLTFTNQLNVSSQRINIGQGLGFWDDAAGEYALFFSFDDPVYLGEGRWNDPSVRASLGFSTNLNTLWTATNASNARSVVGLGATWLTNTNVTNFRAAVGLDRIWAYKSTNQTNATTNLVSDAALTFTAAANTKYAVTLFLKMEFGADSAKGKILVSNAPTVIGNWTYYDTLNAQVAATGIPMTNEALFFQADSEEPASFMQNFVVVAGTNNAPITFQFARGSTNTNTIIVGVGSYLKAEVIE